MTLTTDRVHGLHQYYRDTLTQGLRLATSDIRLTTVIEDVLSGGCNVLEMAESLHAQDIERPGLVAMLLAAGQANLFSDKYRAGVQRPLPRVLSAQIASALKRLIERHPETDWVHNAGLILFKIGQTDLALGLFESCPELLAQDADWQRISCLVALLESDLDKASRMLKLLTSSGQLGRHRFDRLMQLSWRHAAGKLVTEPVTLVIPSGYQAEPRVSWLLTASPGKTTTTIHFMACDPVYLFEHGLANLCSLLETHDEQLHCHVHLYDPTEESVQLLHTLAQALPLLGLTASVEHSPQEAARNVGYACRRFLAADWLLSQFAGHDMVMTDADVLWRQPLRRLLETVGNQPSIVVTTPECTPFWERVVAGLMYLRGDEDSRAFLKEVARVITFNLERGNMVWFLDQIVLSARIDHARNALGLSPSMLVDTAHGAEALTWAITNHKQAASLYQDYKADLLSRHLGMG